MSDQLYMVRDPAGTVFGPANVATLRQWHAQGRIIAAMEISPVGSTVWQAIWMHPDLANLFPVQVQSPAPPTVGAPAATTATSSAPTPASANADKQAIDKTREQAVSYMRELHKVSRTAFWGVLLSGGGVVLCCGCGGLLGIAGILMGVFSLDRNNIKEGEKELDAKVRNGAVAAIVLGFAAMLINGLGMGFLMWARSRGWFGMK